MLYPDLDLKALFINCTLKRSPRTSHTDGLITSARHLYEKNGVETELIRLIDHQVAPGIYPDMTEHGRDNDERPELFEKVLEADILIVGSPIRLGQYSSECQKLIERLYSQSGQLNDKEQYIYYGRVAGCLITGNEDGVKHCAQEILYGLQHIGYTIPPQADAGWIGEVGPGKSYRDDGSGGPENEFTNRNTTFLVYNTIHQAAMLKKQGGIPERGTSRKAWDEDGERWGYVPYTQLNNS